MKSARVSGADAGSGHAEGVDAFIVGAGASGFLHALALRSAGVRIAGVYDPVRERAEWLADLTDALPVRAIDAATSDIVAICSPPAFHVEQAAALARPGRMTFVEKPVAVTLDELGRLAALPGIVPILQGRAGQRAREVRAAFAAGAFGAAPRIECEFRLWRDAEYWSARDPQSWPCGALLSIGIHAVDLVLWCVGRPVVRSDVSDSRLRGSLSVGFDDGTTADIRIALDVRGQNEFRLLVNGQTQLAGSEEDPTAGMAGSPLLVPYLHAALAGQRVSVRDVAAAHALVMPLRPSSPDRASREGERCSPLRDAPASRPRSRCG